MRKYSSKVNEKGWVYIISFCFKKLWFYLETNLPQKNKNSNALNDIDSKDVFFFYSCFQARQRNSEAEKDTKSYPCFLWCSKLEWADVTERIMTAKTLVLMGIVRWKNRKRKLHKAHSTRSKHFSWTVTREIKSSSQNKVL